VGEEVDAEGDDGVGRAKGTMVQAQLWLLG